MYLLESFHGGSDDEESDCNAGRPRFNSWVEKIPWRREWKHTLGSLPRESHGQRSLAGYSPRGHKELDTTERLTLSLSCFLNITWHLLLCTFFKKMIFWCGLFFKSLLHLLQYCFCFMFWSWDTWDISFPTKDWTRTPCIERWSLNYWTAREVPNYF